jgi:maltose O-acetyltransferase
MINFLRKKITNISLINLVKFEVQNYLVFVLKYIPGFLGIYLRSFFYKFFIFNESHFSIFLKENISIEHGYNIFLGKNVGINSNTYINGIGKIVIGNNVLISPNVVISSGFHPVDNVKTIYEEATILKSIVIEDDVYIGANSVILPGVTIRKGSVIGSNSLVNKSTERYTIYGGLPIKKLRKRNLNNIT